MNLDFSYINYSVQRNDAVNTTYAYAETTWMPYRTFCERVSKKICVVGPDVISMILDMAMQEAVYYAANGYRVDIGEALSMYPIVHCTAKDKVDPNTGETVKATKADIKPKKKDVEIHCEVMKNVNKLFRREVKFKRIEPQARVKRRKNKK